MLESVKSSAEQHTNPKANVRASSPLIIGGHVITQISPQTLSFLTRRLAGLSPAQRYCIAWTMTKYGATQRVKGPPMRPNRPRHRRSMARLASSCHLRGLNQLQPRSNRLLPNLWTATKMVKQLMIPPTSMWNRLLDRNQTVLASRTQPVVQKVS